MTTLVTLSTTTCCNCGIAFAFPNDIMDRRRSDGKSFWCPNGHSQYFRESDVKRLERQLAQERAKRDQAEAEARAKSNALTKAETKMAMHRKRISNGTCPCCKRTFAQLQRHMKAKHPNYACAAA